MENLLSKEVINELSLSDIDTNNLIESSKQNPELVKVLEKIGIIKKEAIV